MAIFSQQPDQPAKQAAEPPKRRGGQQQPSLSMIAGDLKVIGDLETNGVVKIEGQVEGTIRADTQVLVSQGALIQGDVHTKEAIIGGEVKGVVHADERVEIQATAVVNGDILTKRIVVLEGGRVNGSVKMEAPGSKSGGGGGGGHGGGGGNSVTYPGDKSRDR